MSREVSSSKIGSNTVTHTNTVYNSQGTLVRSTTTVIDKRTGKPLSRTNS